MRKTTQPATSSRIRTRLSISKTRWTWPDKRVRKASKIYLRDSGLFHALMNLRTVPELQSHPKLGAS